MSFECLFISCRIRDNAVIVLIFCAHCNTALQRLSQLLSIKPQADTQPVLATPCKFDEFEQIAVLSSAVVL